MKANVLLVAALPLLSLVPQAHAQSAKQSLDVLIEIDSDLTVVRTLHIEATPLNVSTVQAFSQQHISYTSGQTAEILEAYTRKADGTQVPVEQSQIASQDGLVGTVTSYADLKIKLIPFRDLELGDTMVLVTRTTERQHYLPNMYSLFEYIPPAPADLTVNYRLTTPKSLNIGTAFHGFAYDEQTSDTATTRHWSGTFPSSYIGERDVANPRAIVPTLEISTVPSYQALGEAYFAAAAPKAAVTPAIQKMADEITAAKDSKRAKAEAIFDWMTRNVQYVAIYFGNGRYVPNDADTILERRLGDCKDHATLMSALLAAEGIASEQVLIDVGPNYALPEVPLLQAFNHAILYVPEFDVYADPTSPSTTFGVLNRLEMDKPVLRVSAAGAVLARTPVGSSSDNVYRNDSTMAIEADGQTHGETRIEATGEEAQLLRDVVAAVEARGEEVELPDIAKLRGISGQQYKITAPSSRDHALPYKVTMSWTGDQLAHITEPSWRPVLGLSPVGLDFQHFFGAFETSKRAYPITCRPGEVQQNMTVTLPPSVLLPSVPGKVTVEGHFFQAQRWWESSGQTLQIHSRLTSTVDQRVCSADVINAIVAKLNGLGNVFAPPLHFVGAAQAEQGAATK